MFTYIKDTKNELKNVVWPTRKQVITVTILVIVMSVVIAYFLGALDYVFAQALAFILNR
ncbi:MAG: preprotein translocase subunit SecE [Minisyncoccia bacterium]